MEINRIIAFAFVGTIFAVLLRKENPQMGLLVTIVTGVLIFIALCAPLFELIQLLRETAEEAGVGSGYFTIILKVIGIAYLAQFGAQVCADAGEKAIATKVEMAGKISIMVASAPVLTALLEVVMHLV